MSSFFSGGEDDLKFEWAEGLQKIEGISLGMGNKMKMMADEEEKDDLPLTWFICGEGLFRRFYYVNSFCDLSVVCVFFYEKYTENLFHFFYGCDEKWDGEKKDGRDMTMIFTPKEFQ